MCASEHTCFEGPKRVKKSTQETVSTALKYTFKTIKFHNMKILWLGVWEKIALKDGGHIA